MVTSADLIGLGMPVNMARFAGLNGRSVNLTATGSTIADALPITSDLNAFGTVSSSTGCILPPAGTRGLIVIHNGGAQTLNVYPQLLEVMNSGSAGGAFTIATGVTRRFFPALNGWIVA